MPIFPEVRLRLTLVQKRTDIKNKAHSILASEMLNLKNALTDIFGKNGRMILSGISSGKSVDQIIASLSPNVRKKAAQIREILDREISQTDWQCIESSVSATRSYVINCLVLPFPFGVTLL